MNRENEEPVVEQVPLSEPRPLTPKERALIEFVLNGPLGRDELRKQAKTARVAGVCSCGCSSVWLDVDPQTPAAQFRPDETTSSRTDWVPLSAYQRKAKWPVEVTLHVVQGRLHELEIWDGRYGVRPRINLTKLEYERHSS